MFEIYLFVEFIVLEVGGSIVDQVVVQGGVYEVLCCCLVEQGQCLQGLVEMFNCQCLVEFGDSCLEVVGCFCICSDNNCVGCDIVQVGLDCLLFGYNVFIGLKIQICIEDVFGLYWLVQGSDGYDVVVLELKGSFFDQFGFVYDFNELYVYYKYVCLLQLIVVGDKLLVLFQIGECSSDVCVFCWVLLCEGELIYLDVCGECDIVLLLLFDFEWIWVICDLVVNGCYLYLNIFDILFVEIIGGDFIIKVENNIEIGQGIYSEFVEDSMQLLDDVQFEFVWVGLLVLLKVLLYCEIEWCGLIYNMLIGGIVCNDVIVQVCVQLFEDYGVIFLGGYYLQGGEYKVFDVLMVGMQFKCSICLLNGEDVLYIFYECEGGCLVLFVYNIIQCVLQNLVFGYGYVLMQDGCMVLFYVEGSELICIYLMQVW